MKKSNGLVKSVNESLVGTEVTEGAVMNGEVAYITIEGEKRLKAEVIDIKAGGVIYLQVFEDTSWVKVGDPVEFTGLPLTVKLGPGILGSVTDGLQNPLYKLAEEEWFLERGMEVPPLDETTLWEFTPQVKKGDVVHSGSVIGLVHEKIFQHKIFVPFSLHGDFTVERLLQKKANTR